MDGVGARSRGNTEVHITTHRSHALARGVVWVLVGQVAFIVTGYALHAFLARWLTLAQYGIFGVAMTLLTWAEITVNNGIPVALQKLLPEALADRTAPDHGSTVPAIKRAAWLWQLAFLIGIFATLFLLAPLLARALHDPRMTFYLRLAFVDLLAMGVYAFYRGMVNGYRDFVGLGLSIAFYSLTKLACSVALVIAGFGVGGALVGNVLSSVGGLIAMFWFTRRWERMHRLLPQSAGPNDASATVIRFAVPVLLFTLVSNLLVNMDLWSVKALVADDAQVGYYAAALNLANAPRFVLLAFSFTLLPSLSGAIADHSWDLARTYLRQTMRYLGLILVPGVALVIGTAEPLVRLVYSAKFAPSAPILAVLIVGASLYSMYVTLVTALLADDRPGLALAIPLSLAPVEVGALVWLIPRWGALAAASVSAITVLVALTLVLAHIFRRFAPKPDLASLGRATVAAGCMFLVTRLYLPTGWLLLPYYILLLIVYLVLLLVLGELRSEDINLLYGIVAPYRKS